MRGFCCIIIFSGFLVGCSYSVIKDPVAHARRSGQGADSGKLDSNAVIGWSLIQNGVLSSCMNCHVGKSLPELSSYPLVVQSLAKIQMVVGSNSMPPAKNGYSNLSLCQKAVLSLWSQQNSPDIGTTKVSEVVECLGSGTVGGDPLPPLNQTQVTYANVLSRILQKRCINCHNPDAKEAEVAAILFFPYSEIQKRSTLWRAPGISSKLVHMLKRSDEDRMPPVEEPPLAPDEIDFIIRWIDAGKPQ